MINTHHAAHVKKAELLSSVGAGVLGAGIGLLLSNMLAQYVLPILLMGLISHSAGMFQKHWLEQGKDILISWVEWLYWLCWVALAALLIYIVIRLF